MEKGNGGGRKAGKDRERSESIGSLDEIWKRKREEMEKSGEEEEGIFRECKKTPTSSGTGTVEGEKEWGNLMKEMKMELRKVVEEIKDEIRDQKKLLQGELEEIRREFREQKEKWRKEGEQLKKGIENLKDRIEELKGENNGKTGDSKGGDRKSERNIENRLKEVKRNMERREKEEKRKNIIIRGVEVREGKRREAVEEILKIVGVKVEIKEVRRVRGINEKEGEMVLVKLGSEEQKGEVIGKKKILKGRKKRISEDLTWRERKARWNLQEIARSEERKGRKVWVRQDRIRIDEQWWR